MKVYRGPSTKNFHAAEHELVADITISKSATFTQDALVIMANVTKAPLERQAVAHLQLNAQDIVALNQRFLTGLAGRSVELDLLKERVTKASQELYTLYEKLISDSFSDSGARLQDFESRLDEAREVIGTLANELDPRN